MKVHVDVADEEVCSGCKLFELHIDSLYSSDSRTDLFRCENLEICRNVIERVKRSEEKTGTWLPVIRIDRFGNELPDDDEWYGDLFQCSICGEHMIGNESKFCLGCGAKMTVKEQED